MRVSDDDIIILQGLHIDVIKAIIKSNNHNVEYVDIDFSSIGDDECFMDTEHVTYKGQEIVSKQLYNKLFKSKCRSQDAVATIHSKYKKKALKYFEKYATKFAKVERNIDKYPEIKEFINKLKSLKNIDGVNGTTVVNCNPYTFGHRHLIEYAASRVDHLFVFVVEENLSYFDFDGRLAMVVDGTKDISNVTVLPSGKYMMSNITYPNYFLKDEVVDVCLDAKTDMFIFGEYIAPILNIKIRFVGEELKCNVTREHNQQMRNILPTYGIRVEEIMRKTSNDEIIVASLVREYIKNNNMKDLCNLVPQSTLKYILRDDAVST